MGDEISYLVTELKSDMVDVFENLKIIIIIGTISEVN